MCEQPACERGDMHGVGRESEASFHANQYTCVAGFANGVCVYDFIAEGAHGIPEARFRL